MEPVAVQRPQWDSEEQRRELEGHTVAAAALETLAVAPDLSEAGLDSHLTLT